MAIVSIDSSSDSLYIALEVNDEIFCKSYPDLRRADKKLLDGILEIMDEHDVCLDDIEYFVISEGPGSFTSLRIAASVAKGFTSSKGIRIKSVSSLLTLALSYKNHDKDRVVIPLIDARMNRFYSAVFKDKERLSDDEDISFENILKKPYDKIAFVTHPDERDKVLSLIDIASDSYKKDILFASKDQIQNPAVTMIEIAKNMDFDDYSKGPKYVREHSGLCRE